MIAEPPAVSRRQATVAAYDVATGAGRLLLDDGVVLALPADAAASGGGRRLRRGQRVMVELQKGDSAQPQVRLVHLLTISPPADETLT